MTVSPKTARKRRLPTRKAALVFRGKAALLQLRRAVVDFADRTVERHAKESELTSQPVIAVSKTLLWTESAPEERFLLAGKIHNLRLAVRELDGIEIPAGKTFSFWKQLGRAGRFNGYVKGRELREGCIIPNIGGGLCQISNALYDAALQAGFEIVERHPHTQVIPGSLAEQGRDATVFWNYIDLRFRSDNAFRIDAKLDGESLTVQFRGEKNGRKQLHQINRTFVHADSPNSCATCEVGDCLRVVDSKAHTDFGRRAYLLDEFMPEFDRYVNERRTEKDRLLIPLDGRRFRKGNYAWTTAGFGSVSQSLLVTAKRSYRSRKLSAQGAARQINLLAMYEELAESYARRLSFDALHVVVQQSLLPFLWKKGHLGGRTFDVLMTALPMAEIQKKLDLAHSLHRKSKTLGDFRADASLVAAETDALEAAAKIITPHSGIASLFPNQAELIEWKTPVAKPRGLVKSEKPQIVFPSSTVGRKGCYELREAVLGLDVKLILHGPLVEGADFWNGFDTERGGDDWPQSADLVVLPAIIEHKPRRLLLAAASGIPVIASHACGVDRVPGISTIEAGDADSLRKEILAALGR